MKYRFAVMFTLLTMAAGPAMSDQDANSQQTGATESSAVLDTIAVSSATTPDEVPTTRDRPKSRLLEEVVVTAQKREENLQDVPISVSAFSAGMLDAKGVAGIDSLPNITPGLTINNTAGFSILYLRGVGTDAFLMADPSVAAYIDGVYSPFTQGLGQDLGVVERIEVEKGPQGTLFGRNAVAGAINIVTKDPSAKPETSAQLAYGNYDSFKSKLYTNIPLTDSLAVSVTGLYNHVGSYLSGKVDGHDVPDEVTKGARVKVKMSLLDNLDVILTGSESLLQGIGSYAAPDCCPSPVIGKALMIQGQDGYSTNLSAPAYSIVRTRTFSGNAKLTTDWFDVKLLGSNQKIKSSSLYEYDGTPLPIAEFEPSNFYAKFDTAELQVVSNKTSWASEWLEWIGGAYYFKGTQGFKPIDLIAGGTDLTTDRLFNINIPSDVAQLLLPYQDALNLPTGRISIVGIIDTLSYSGFGQETTHFTDWLALTLGARYQTEKRKLVQSTAGLQQTNGDTVVNYLDASPESATTTSFKPKVSIDLRPWDGTLIYLSYQQAIKSGTYNPINVLSLPSYVKPEQMEAYEVGVKTEFFGGLMRFNAAAFQYEIKNLQVQFVSIFNGGIVSFENAGGSKIQGMDFDTTVQLVPNVIDNLVFTVSGAYIPDAKYTSYKNASGYGAVDGLYSGNNDYTGNRTVRTPKFSGTAGLSKTFDAYSGSIEVGGDIYYNSGYSYLAQGCALSYVCQSAYHTVNARISYLYDPWGLRVTLYGNNLTDEKYSASRLITDFGANQLLAPPLTYGMRLNWDF